MALKLLQPSLRPLGQFDLADADHAAMTGGECVALETASGEQAASDVAQVGPYSNTDTLTFSLSEYSRGTLCGLADEGSASGYGTQFGHLVGSNAGQAVAVPLNTGVASGTGAVVIGPGTMKGSGKVTVWHAPGLYAVNAGPLAVEADIPAALIAARATAATLATVDLVSTPGDCVIDGATTANAPLFAASNGKLYTSDTATSSGTTTYTAGAIATGSVRSDQVGVYCGHMKDSSLVSTPAYLAGSGSALGSVYSSTAEEHVVYFYGNQPLL